MRGAVGPHAERGADLRVGDRQVAVGDALPPRRAVARARHIAERAVAVEERLLADEQPRRVVGDHAAQLALDAPLLDRGRRLAPDEVRVLAEADRPAEAGLVGVVLLVDVLAPQAVALLETQRVVRRAADRDRAERLAPPPPRGPPPRAATRRP